MQAQTHIIEFPSLKSSQRYGAKVKTGCITCKSRRIRCDEGKPNCQKCTGTGRQCGGYVQAKGTAKHKQNGAQDLIQSIIRFSSPASVPTLSVSSDSAQYLEFFHTTAGRTLCSNYDNNFWRRLAPQMAQTEPSVRHALIALAYLNRAESGTIKNAAVSLSVDRRGLLFHHYNKSVRHLIERINDASYTPEIGLVTCLLFICIEFLRANYHTAFTHLYNGVKVISEWYQNYSKDGTSTKNSVPSISEITRAAFESGTTMTEIVPMFFRTVTCALLFGVEIEKIIGMPVTTPRSFDHRPFYDIYDARTASLEFQNASLAFIRDTAPRSFPPPKVRRKTIALQERLLEGHRSWWHAFEVFERSTQLSPEEKAMASELKAGWYAIFIAVACVTSVEQTPYDAYIDYFKAVVRHIKRVFDYKGLPQQPAANFTFEVMLLPLLYFALQRCRCPTTRREALAQMERNAPREALWDYDQHALVSRRVIDIEEEEVDPVTGWPVEDTRLWCAVLDGSIESTGGFWVNFARATWVVEGARRHEEALGGKEEEEEYPGFRKRGDNQWQEWFQL
ncbi:hypothetical protein P280DRAFT_452890 [Massarina eburnea CBS 473.64]|uniref:Zn(2)-C6 fungal-type domain-containing protein n=1 Tax=Massarina eburnea CBS 473.64 TaxID=1395130 RepID=A0A6A6S1F7_9PLEO|nr:hypothetical protein P280DRAFT_452890 [Massarina eburnea CBS 473.64]